MKDFCHQKIFLTQKKLTNMLGWGLFIQDFNILRTAGLPRTDKKESNNSLINGYVQRKKIILTQGSCLAPNNEIFNKQITVVGISTINVIDFNLAILTNFFYPQSSLRDFKLYLTR